MILRLLFYSNIVKSKHLFLIYLLIFSGTIPTNFKLYYRTFSDAVTTNYFCNTYPPATPNVTSQIEATGGTVTIVSRPIYNETTGALLRYDHQISITDLVLVNQEGNKIVDSNFVFGTYKTNKQ